MHSLVVPKTGSPVRSSPLSLLVTNVPAAVDGADIYAPLSTQLSYKWGSPGRTTIAQSYPDSKRFMLTMSICMFSCALIAAALWRDINVKNIKQVKGGVV